MRLTYEKLRILRASLPAHVHAYLDGTGIGDDPRGPLFRTIRRGTGQLSDTRLPTRFCLSVFQKAVIPDWFNGHSVHMTTFEACDAIATLR
jgi:hypothetical protein